MQRRDSSLAVSAASPVLLATDLRKAYGPRVALQGLSFALPAGHVLGFLGPNGAGKTTAIRILTTVLEPTSGSFFVAGTSSAYPEQIRRQIGVQPESLGFLKHLTAIEYLTYFGRLYGRTRTDARAGARRLLADVSLEGRATSLIGTYSRGMQQRLGIARALVHDPVVVFLDEPTLGLDPRGQQDLLTLVRRIAAERGAGVILCSHMLAEIEGVCDDVVILSAGEVVAAGPVADVTGQAQGNIVRIDVPVPAVASARQLLATMPGVVTATPGGQIAGRLVVELAEAVAEDQHSTNRLLEVLIRAGIPVLHLEAAGGRLRDVFLQLTEEAPA